MDGMEDVRIDDTLTIPAGEIGFEASRSGGPGGQHVNKASTKVTLTFDIDASAVLSDDQRARIRARLASRLSGGSVLRVSSQRSRSQIGNRDDALAKLGELVRRALAERKTRKKTRPTRAQRERRLDEKRRKSEVKRRRTIVYDGRDR
jgi:ribosome-associated protein